MQLGCRKRTFSLYVLISHGSTSFQDPFGSDSDCPSLLRERATELVREPQVVWNIFSWVRLVQFMWMQDDDTEEPGAAPFWSSGEDCVQSNLSLS